MPSSTHVEITLNGRAIDFVRHASGMEYEISSSYLEDVNIGSCMAALRDAAAPFDPDQNGDLDCSLTAVIEDKLPWEDSVFGAYFDLHSDSCSVEFVLNTALGAHETALIDPVSSSVVNTGFELASIEHGDDRPVLEQDGWHTWAITLSCSSPELTFDDFFIVRRRLSQAVFLPSDMITTPHLAFRMVQLGQFDALLGCEESEWLEVKSSPYDLKRGAEQAWKLELAKDVAQFANSEIGGLLVVGLRTRCMNGIDTISEVTAFPVRDTRVQSYRDIIKERVHPPITGLQIGAVDRDRLQIVYAFIPPQREENKPFLITGALIDGIYESQGITITRRRGDASIPVSAREIHSALVAGRALLRGTASSLHPERGA